MKKLLFILVFLAGALLWAQDGSIEFKGRHGKKLSLDFDLHGLADPDPVDNRVIPILMLVMGSGIILLWMLDVASGRFRDQGGILEWKSPGGDRMWLHLLAEYATAGLLIAGGAGLLGQHGWGYQVALVALGASSYSSLNSLAWAFAEKGRLRYGIPILISLVLAVASIVLLLT